MAIGFSLYLGLTIYLYCGRWVSYNRWPYTRRPKYPLVCSNPSPYLIESRQTRHRHTQRPKTRLRFAPIHTKPSQFGQIGSYRLATEMTEMDRNSRNRPKSALNHAKTCHLMMGLVMMMIKLSC